jgi:hypothetical protein
MDRLQSVEQFFVVRRVAHIEDDASRGNRLAVVHNMRRRRKEARYRARRMIAPLAAMPAL